MPRKARTRNDSKSIVAVPTAAVPSASSTITAPQLAEVTLVSATAAGAPVPATPLLRCFLGTELQAKEKADIYAKALHDRGVTAHLMYAGPATSLSVVPGNEPLAKFPAEYCVILLGTR